MSGGPPASPPPLQILREIGPLLYGDYWQTPAAGLLGVEPRTVRRWLAGDRGTPERIVPILQEALRTRLHVVQEYVGRI